MDLELAKNHDQSPQQLHSIISFGKLRFCVSRRMKEYAMSKENFMAALSPISFASKVEESANGARYKSQGQARSASPLVSTPTKGLGLKGRNTHRITPFQGWI